MASISHVFLRHDGNQIDYCFYWHGLEPALDACLHFGGKGLYPGMSPSSPSIHALPGPPNRPQMRRLHGKFGLQGAVLLPDGQQ